MTQAFANPSVVSQSWYPAMRSRTLEPRAIRSFELGLRRIAVYRDDEGGVHAMEARCPHLGADLAKGGVEGDAIRCAFHHWSFGANGNCRDAPGHLRPPVRRARIFPAVERWGFVWIFNGPQALFGLPEPADAHAWRAVALPSQRLNCHPHLALANGLDLTHYETLHGMRFSHPPSLSVTAPYEVSVEMRGRPTAQFWRWVSGTRRREIVARFTTIGGSLAWSAVSSPIPFHVIFTGRPDRQGRCVTRTIFLFRRGVRLDCLRGLALMATLLHDDRRMLDGMDFRPDFAATDRPLKEFAAIVNALGSW
jgi:nitrite reductase/ring-hydroxylating ferredoxin subunit